MNDLPELGDIFDNDKKNKKDNKDLKENFIEKGINIYISKEEDKWIAVSFIDVAPSNIGLHVLLPIDVDLHGEDLDKVRIKFEKAQNSSSIVLKEVPVLVRWQEKDPLSGKVKIGVHFHGDLKTDHIIIDILNKLKAQKK